MTKRITIVVHGGAGFIADHAAAGAEQGVRAAALAGFDVLRRGGSAVDAVEAAVRCMEDNTRFNAGTGSVLTRAGTVEMDAMMMEGRRLNAGCTTCVKRVRNPISLARKIMESSPHVFLSGPTAEDFAAAHGFPLIDNEELITDLRRAQLSKFLAESKPDTLASPSAAEALRGTPVASSYVGVASPLTATTEGAGHDTVGAVALDAEGNVAAATSTGGLTGKWVGRIGDTPLVGCGGYADNEFGAVSTTGTGEYIIRFNLAREVLHTYERLRSSSEPGETLLGAGIAAEAVAATLRRMKERMDDPGEGVIFVAPDGDVGIAHSSLRMSWAAVSCEASALSSAAAYDSQGKTPCTWTAGIELGDHPAHAGVRSRIAAWHDADANHLCTV